MTNASSKRPIFLPLWPQFYPLQLLHASFAPTFCLILLLLSSQSRYAVSFSKDRNSAPESFSAAQKPFGPLFEEGKFFRQDLSDPFLLRCNDLRKSLH